MALADSATIGADSGAQPADGAAAPGWIDIPCGPICCPHEGGSGGGIVVSTPCCAAGLPVDLLMVLQYPGELWDGYQIPLTFQGLILPGPIFWWQGQGSPSDPCGSGANPQAIEAQFLCNNTGHPNKFTAFYRKVTGGFPICAPDLGEVEADAGFTCDPVDIQFSGGTMLGICSGTLCSPLATGGCIVVAA